METRTTVVNKRLSAYDELICRGTIFGNPYEIGPDGLREEVIQRYRGWFKFMLRDERFRRHVLELRGKRLGCFCKQPNEDVACHGDVIVEYLEERQDRKTPFTKSMSNI